MNGIERTRDSYIDVGAAIRQAQDRARAAGRRLGERDHRVLFAVVALVASYSRLQDRLTVSQIGEAAGGIDDRATQRCLAKLVEEGCLTREPTRGRRPALTGIPRSQETVVSDSQPRSQETTVAVGQPRSLETPNPGLQRPPTREDFREESRARANATPSAPVGSAGGRPAQPAEDPPAPIPITADLGPTLTDIIERRRGRQLELGDDLAVAASRRRPPQTTEPGEVAAAVSA